MAHRYTKNHCYLHFSLASIVDVVMAIAKIYSKCVSILWNDSNLKPNENIGILALSMNGKRLCKVLIAVITCTIALIIIRQTPHISLFLFLSLLVCLYYTKLEFSTNCFYSHKQMYNHQCWHTNRMQFKCFIEQFQLNESHSSHRLHIDSPGVMQFKWQIWLEIFKVLKLVN